MSSILHITHVSAVIGMASRTGVTVVMKKAQQQHGESKQGPQKLADSGSPILYLVIFTVAPAIRSENLVIYLLFVVDYKKYTHSPGVQLVPEFREFIKLVVLGEILNPHLTSDSAEFASESTSSVLA
jgi:hypothetical protein